MAATPVAVKEAPVTSEPVRVAVEAIPSNLLPTAPNPVVTAKVAAMAEANTVASSGDQQHTAQELTDPSKLAGSGRSYIVTGSSRQNLNSIVEAIRHLEGDHLFSEDTQQVSHQIFNQWYCFGEI